MWIEYCHTNKSGIEAVRDSLIQNGVEYVQLSEDGNNEITVAFVEKHDTENSILRLTSYKVENNVIYMYQE